MSNFLKDFQKLTASPLRLGFIYRLPTFIVFKNGTVAQTVKGADPSQLGPVVQKIVEEIETSGCTGSSGGSGSNTGTGGGFGDADARGGPWLGASLPRGYKDVTEEVDLRGLELLNADAEFGGARELFEARRPSALDSKGKGKEEKEGEDKGKRRDWVESDTDAQLMLFVPFQSTLKVHSLHVTSLSPSEGEEEVVRPRTIELYTNRAHTLGFDEAESVPETQRIELKPGDWDKETGTARVELRFVKFQNVTSLVIFVVDGEGDGERTRIDRIRLIGESGEKREMGKLEKIGEGSE